MDSPKVTYRQLLDALNKLAKQGMLTVWFDGTTTAYQVEEVHFEGAQLFLTVYDDDGITY